MSSLDDQLRALEAKYRGASPSSSAGDSLDEALASLQRDYQRKSTVKTTDTGDRLTEMLKALEQDALSNKLKDCQNNQQIRQEINQIIQAKQQARRVPLPETDLKAIAAAEKEKQERDKYWRRKAGAWLKDLDPISNEGLWFMEFAESYPTTLDAAIDYLMALE